METTPIKWKKYNDDWNNEYYKIDDLNKTQYFETDSDNIKIDTNIKVEVFDNEDKRNVQDIINCKIVKNDIETLSDIVFVLKWSIKNSTLNQNNFKQFLNAIIWIKSKYKYFITELKIPEIQSKFQYELIRSSYKLCPQKSNCIYQYPDTPNSKLCCKYQHYPYANLYNDCQSIINYINTYFNSDSNNEVDKSSKLIKALTEFTIQAKDINTNELIRCLTTINFVTDIIHRELDTINKYRKNESNYNIRKYHCYHEQFKFKAK